MSGQDDQSDKSFDPTPQKLLEARKKGDIPRSTELLTAASYIGFLLAFMITGAASFAQLGNAMSILVGQSAQLAPLFFDGSAFLPAGGVILSTGQALLPTFGLPAAAVLLVLFATRGIVFAPSKIQPKLTNISLISNAKNKFGRNGIFQFFLSFIKLLIYSGCLGIFLYLNLEAMVAAIQTNPQAIVVLLAKICLSFFFVVVIVSTLIGGLDAIWQFFEHRRKNRMSRKEVQDETKNSEGDPHMKQERRQRAQSLAGTQMASEVAKADVIIVNPTHYAIALRWDRKPGEAPICVAKGIDAMAFQIRQIALDHSVPIHSDPPAARAIHATTDVGAEISPQHYRAVAAAIRFSEDMRRKARMRAY
ncbi:MAG: flagellar type III secretion system protein FlhB [Pseudomonadota bacterium]